MQVILTSSATLFPSFLPLLVINACNASLRNQKFSTMAIRTRKQYLNDLAEQSTTSTTIDQANTSGRVGELFLCSHLLISHLIPNHLHSLPSPLTLITSSLTPPLLHPPPPPSSPYVPSQPLSCCPFTLSTPLFFLYTAGLLRNLCLKKKERMRQDSTLIYTGGALSWHVSILRGNKPLPFSEEHDTHIECIMALGPDMVVFIDYFTRLEWG